MRWCGVLPVALIPLASLFLTYHRSITYLACTMGVTKIFQSAFFSSITIATNRIVPKEMRSSMNGFGGSGAGAAKALGPIVAGYWMAICLSWDDANNEHDRSLLIGAAAAYSGIGSLAFVVALNLQMLEHTS
jgi:MFS family permease